MAPVVVFDNVSKKFQRGERRDSLRDLVPALVRGAFRRGTEGTLKDEEFWALRNVSFEVEPGTALGIIGGNGAGKSTALKVLTKLLKPTMGRCSVKGRIGALIEVAAGFHPDLTGRENVFLQGAIMGMRRTEIAERFDEIIEFSGVGASIDTPVKRYSSGMNARLGFSVAAHLRPDVLIIDEVLSVGDMTFQEKCFDRMLEFKGRGIAIVLVSHNLQAVSTLCEHAIYLASSVKASGQTTEVLEAYARASQQTEQTSENASFAVGAISFTAPGLPGTHREIAPGTPLTLRVRCRTSEPLDDVTFGLLIRRSTDQLVVYSGQVHRRELDSVSALSGEFVLDLHFRPHLVRGHYSVALNVLHTPTHTFFVRSKLIATFSIQENRSRKGIADIEFSASVGAETDACALASLE